MKGFTLVSDGFDPACKLCFRDRAGRETTLHSRRFVSMDRMHQAALAWELTPENVSGTAELVSALDGRILNHGCEDRGRPGRADPRLPGPAGTGSRRASSVIDPSERQALEVEPGGADGRRPLAVCYA